MDTLSWETLNWSMQQGAPFVQPVGGTKGCQFVFDPSSGRLAFRLPITDIDPVPRLGLSHIWVVKERVEEAFFLAIYIADQSNFAAFHQLATLATSIYESPGVSAHIAIEEALQSWADLLQRRALLSDDAQIGLRGELAFLGGLIRVHGRGAVEAWTAYNKAIPGRHDFRISTSEIEVKSTRRREPIHRINGLAQLRASPNFSLFVLSIQFEQSGNGNGFSLSESVHEIRVLLGEATKERKIFEERLTLARYRDVDAEFYDEKLLIASPPVLIEIDNQIPILTSEKLGGFINSSALSRLSSVTYDINFSGLGFDINSMPFKKIVGDLELN